MSDREHDQVAPKSHADTPIEKMSIGEIIPRLKVGQLWGALVIVGGLFTGAFILGYKTNTLATGAAQNAVQIDLDKARATLDSLQTELIAAKSVQKRYRRKDRFLSLLLNYHLNGDTDSEVRKVLDEYVLKLVNESENDASFVNVVKGQARQTTVVFWDGSRWPVPEEFAAPP